MKKVILSVAAVFAFGFANAQETVSEGFSKGDVFINGALSFGSTKTGDSKATGFEVAPSVGYFVTENIAVGVRLGFASNKQDVVEPIVGELKQTSIAAGAFGRYYFTPASKFSFFGELAAEYNNTKSELGPGEIKTNGFAVAVSPGISYFVSKNIALEAAFGILGYSSDKPDFDGAEKTNNFAFGLDTRDIR